MLKNFVEEQRDRERNGFYDRHRVAQGTEIDYDAINRRKQVLSNLPSYRRTIEDSASDGRAEYEAERSHSSSDGFAALDMDSQWNQEDVWEQAKTDPRLRTKLYLRGQMKSQNLGSHLSAAARSSDGRQLTAGMKFPKVPLTISAVAERPLLRPPPKVEPVDSDKARQDFNLKNMLSNRDPDWRPVAQPLFKREQHVFLPQGTERIIQEMCVEPIKQRPINVLSKPRPEEVPDLDSNLPQDFNKDMLRYIPKSTRHGRDLKNPEYYELIRPKVDAESAGIPGLVLGGVDGPPRSFEPNAGIPSDPNERTIIKSRDEHLQHREMSFARGDQIPSEPQFEPHASDAQQQTSARAFSPRSYSEGAALSTEDEGYPAEARFQGEQKRVRFAEGGNIIEADAEALRGRDIDSTVRQFKRMTVGNPVSNGLDIDSDPRQHQERSEHLGDVRRSMPSWNKSSEMDVVSETARGASTWINPQHVRRDHAELANVSVEYTEPKTFRTLLGGQYRPTVHPDLPSVESDATDRLPVNHRTEHLQRMKAEMAEAQRADFDHQINLPRLEHSDGQRTLQRRENPSPSKVDADARHQAGVQDHAVRQLQRLEHAQAAKVDAEAKDQRQNLRDDHLQMRKLSIADAPRLDVETEAGTADFHQIAEGHPRPTQPHQGADMDVPYAQGAKYNRVSKDSVRTKAEPFKIDYEDPMTKTRKKDQILRRSERPSSRPATPITCKAKPEFQVPGLNPADASLRQNHSRPPTPRPSSCRKQDVEIERIKEYLDLPQPF